MILERFWRFQKIPGIWKRFQKVQGSENNPTIRLKLRIFWKSSDDIQENPQLYIYFLYFSPRNYLANIGDNYDTIQYNDILKIKVRFRKFWVRLWWDSKVFTGISEIHRISKILMTFYEILQKDYFTRSDFLPYSCHRSNACKSTNQPITS